MPFAARWASPLGLRPALLLSEVSLAIPGLLCLALWSIPLTQGLALVSLNRRTTLLSLATGASLWGACLGVLELQSFLWRPPEGYLEAFRQLHEALRPRSAVDALFSVGAIALAPALCEELLFRGIVLPSLLRPLRPAGAILVSSLLFAAIHLDATPAGISLYRVPFALAVGAGLGCLRVGTGSLFAPVLAHALLNTITFALAPFSDDPAASSPQPFLGAGLLVAGTASTLLALRHVARTNGHTSPTA